MKFFLSVATQNQNLGLLCTKPFVTKTFHLLIEGFMSAILKMNNNSMLKDFIDNVIINIYIVINGENK